MAAERRYQNEVRVYVAGQEIRDVYSCSYSIRTEMARSGLPTGTFRRYITSSLAVNMKRGSSAGPIHARPLTSSMMVAMMPPCSIPG